MLPHFASEVDPGDSSKNRKLLEAFLTGDLPAEPLEAPVGLSSDLAAAIPHLERLQETEAAEPEQPNDQQQTQKTGEVGPEHKRRRLPWQQHTSAEEALPTHQPTEAAATKPAETAEALAPPEPPVEAKHSEAQEPPAQPAAAAQHLERSEHTPQPQLSDEADADTQPAAKDAKAPAKQVTEATAPEANMTAEQAGTAEALASPEPTVEAAPQPQQPDGQPEIHPEASEETPATEANVDAKQPNDAAAEATLQGGIQHPPAEEALLTHQPTEAAATKPAETAEALAPPEPPVEAKHSEAQEPPTAQPAAAAQHLEHSEHTPQPQLSDEADADTQHSAAKDAKAPAKQVTEATAPEANMTAEQAGTAEALASPEPTVEAAPQPQQPDGQPEIHPEASEETPATEANVDAKQPNDAAAEATMQGGIQHPPAEEALLTHQPTDAAATKPAETAEALAPPEPPVEAKHSEAQEPPTAQPAAAAQHLERSEHTPQPQLSDEADADTQPAAKDAKASAKQVTEATAPEANMTAEPAATAEASASPEPTVEAAPQPQQPDGQPEIHPEASEETPATEANVDAKQLQHPPAEEALLTHQPTEAAAAKPAETAEASAPPEPPVEAKQSEAQEPPTAQPAAAAQHLEHSKNTPQPQLSDEEDTDTQHSAAKDAKSPAKQVTEATAPEANTTAEQAATAEASAPPEPPVEAKQSEAQEPPTAQPAAAAQHLEHSKNTPQPQLSDEEDTDTQHSAAKDAKSPAKQVTEATAPEANTTAEQAATAEASAPPEPPVEARQSEVQEPSTAQPAAAAQHLELFESTPQPQLSDEEDTDTQQGLAEALALALQVTETRAAEATMEANVAATAQALGPDTNLGEVQKPQTAEPSSATQSQGADSPASTPEINPDELLQKMHLMMASPLVSDAIVKQEEADVDVCGSDPYGLCYESPSQALPTNAAQPAKNMTPRSIRVVRRRTEKPKKAAAQHLQQVKVEPQEPSISRSSRKRRQERESILARNGQTSQSISPEDRNLAKNLLDPPRVSKRLRPYSKTLMPAAPNADVKCMQLPEKFWKQLVDNKDDHLVRSYNIAPLPATLHIVTSQNESSSSCIYMGTVKVDSCFQIFWKKDLKQYVTDPLEMAAWRSKMQQGNKVFVWHLTAVQVLPQPRNVKFLGGKFRNRHFVCKADQLLSGIDIDMPRPSLFSTSGFFLKLLPLKFYENVRKVAESWDGHTFRMGTTCSGSDVCVTAARSLVQQINEEFGVSAPHFQNVLSDTNGIQITSNNSAYIYIYMCIYRNFAWYMMYYIHTCRFNVFPLIVKPVFAEVAIGFRHIFSAEIDDAKRAYILATSEVDHVFGDVACFPKKKGHCFKCDRVHRIDPDKLNIDCLIVGPSCKDLSAFATYFPAFIYSGFHTKLKIYNICMYSVHVHQEQTHIYIYNDTYIAI